jgi:hypothetical protein
MAGQHRRWGWSDPEPTSATALPRTPPHRPFALEADESLARQTERALSLSTRRPETERRVGVGWTVVVAINTGWPKASGAQGAA